MFPAPMARATAALMANLMADETAPPSQPLHGVGIGTAPSQGRACVVADPNEALELLESGDVLVTRVTGPSFNSLLPIVGALVVEEGGPMCHAAIVARDFDMGRVYSQLDKDEALWQQRMHMGRSFYIKSGHAFTSWWKRYKK